MDSYADVADLRGWLGLAEDEPDPLNAVSKLRSATILVANAAQISPYDTPASNAVQPLNDATCAQVAEWLRLGIEPGVLAAGSGAVKRTTILDATVENDTTGDTARLDTAGRELATEARDILQAAGLLWLPVPAGDSTPYLLDYGLVGIGGVNGYVWATDPTCWPFV